MKKRVLTAALLLVLLCGVWMVSASAASYGTIFGGWLRLRANPSYDAAVITSYPSGSVVTVLSRSNGWARVLTGDYRIGYMDQRYLIIDGKYPVQPTAQPAPSKRVWTTVNRTAWITSQNGKGVRMRNAPEVSSSNVLGLYPVGRTVKEIRISNDGWSYIRIDGKYGYMMSQFLTTNSGPVSTPVPQPDDHGQTFKSIKLNITRPYVGDTLQVSAVPSGASFTAIWYNATTKVLLSTKKTYKVQDSDVGYAITVRVTGADGTIAEVSTDPVTTGPSGSGLGGAETLSASPSVTSESALPLGSESDVSAESESSSSSESEGSGSEYDDLPDFVRRTMEQGGVAVQPADSGSDTSEEEDI